MCSVTVTVHISKNAQNELFCQTTNSDELALGMKRWLEVHFISLKNIFAKYKYFIIYRQKTDFLRVNGVNLECSTQLDRVTP